MTAQLATAPTQQKDFLCGSFCTSRILHELGIEDWDGEPVDQDLVALRAGGTVPDPRLPAVVPPGAVSRPGYLFELPIAPLDEAGTSPGGLIRVVESASGGRLSAIPMRGGWTAEHVERAIDGAGSLGARLIANLDTARLWGSHPPVAQLLAELDGQEVAGPPPDWQTGHFVELATLVRGRRGSLVVVRDTYPTLGLDGYHLQPPRTVAEALLRGDGREGGVLAVVPRDVADQATALARELGLDVDLWNNGCRSYGNGDR